MKLGDERYMTALGIDLTNTSQMQAVNFIQFPRAPALKSLSQLGHQFRWLKLRQAAIGTGFTAGGAHSVIDEGFHFYPLRGRCNDCLVPACKFAISLIIKASSILGSSRFAWQQPMADCHHII
jgi:hypothetical protein